MKQHLFTVAETCKKGTEFYHLTMTDAEMSAYLKAKQEMNGYVPGLGGDRSYGITAWHATPCFG